MDLLYQTLRSTHAKRIGQMNVYTGRSDHGIYFNTDQQTIAYANAAGRFGPWHDTAKDTFLGIPILRMQHINKEKIRKQMQQQSVTPVMLTTTGSNSNVSLLMYVVIGSTIRRVAHNTEMDVLIAKYLAKLLRHMNATQFDPVMFLEDVIKRMYLRKKKERKPVNNHKKTWFGMPLDEAKTATKENRVHSLVSDVMSLNKANRKHKIIVENGQVCIYNTSMCPPNHVVILPIKLLTRKISTPSVMRQLFKRHCVGIREVIRERFPESTIIKAEITGQKVKLYEQARATPSTVSLRDVLSRILRGNTLDTLITRKEKREKAVRYRYQDIGNISENILENMAKREDIDTTLVDDAIEDVRQILLKLIISQRKEHQQAINTWNTVMEHAPRAFYKEVAGKLNYTSAKLRPSDKEILILMMQGMVESNAIKAVKTGIRNNKYLVHNENKNVIVKVPLQKVEKAMSRHNDRVNHNTIARRIIKHKRNPPPTGFDYAKNRYVLPNGKTIPGDEFAHAYRHFAPNSSSFNNTNIATKAIQRHTEQKRFKILRELETKRLKVEEKLIKSYPKSKSKNTMNFASWLLKESYDIGGALYKRPLFTGNVGKPTKKNVDISPMEQYKAYTNNKGITEDGCKEQPPWAESGGYSLSMHQSVAYGICRLRALGFLQRVPGLFCYYSVGAGKTVVVLSCIIAYWNTDKCIIPASARSNSKEGGNDLAKFAEEATLYFPWFRSDLVGPVTVNNQVFFMQEYPFAHGVDEAKEQLIMRLRMGHALAGHPKATSLSPNNLLNTYTTAHNLITGKHKENPGYMPAKKTTTRPTKGKKTIENCVFILDEIQLLFNPPASEQAYGKEYKGFRKILLERNPESCFVLALTATPGDTKQEILDLYSVIVAKNVKDIPKSVTTSVYVTGDTRFFPRVKVKRHCIHLPHTITNDNTTKKKRGGEKKKRTTPRDTPYKTSSTLHPAEMYTQFYILRLAGRLYTHTAAAKAMEILEIGKAPPPMKTKQNQTNAETLTREGKMKQVFYRHAKESTEYLPITDNSTRRVVKNDFGDNDSGEDSVLQQEARIMDALQRYAKNPRYGVIMARTKAWGSSTRGGASKEKDNRKVFLLSPKVIRMIRTLVKEEGVHFVYVENNNTMRLIAHVLHTVYGWDMYRAANRNSKNETPKFGFLSPLAVGKTRFLDTRKASPTGPVTDSQFIETMGGTTVDAKSLMQLIQSNDNVDGGRCRVVFATGDYYKGVNTKGVRHLHVLSPMAKWTDLLQLVGRATRFRSHCALEKKKRNVTVHTWSLEPPEVLGSKFKELFPDEYVHDHALKVYINGIGGLNQKIINRSIQILGDSFSKLDELEEDLAVTCDKVWPSITMQNLQIPVNTIVSSTP